MENDYEATPLLLEGYALQSSDGRLALCVAAHPPMTPHIINDEARLSLKWKYEMFDEGDTVIIDNHDVKNTLTSGGRVVIVEM